ncbi:probable LRR receptor-like serine/threonine-protein kinase At3g47570 [Phoenix dactylifera]|uniref:Receptor kinase-like protein Xa21 n=1 Tax=Phoenix dactylifera TaxID=42345 RepID=A0A8B7C7Q6_PHODC|nr:probable LRR receptor-like serine/threonine-protein kinase At3g47570 [Phoenix dactylifera]
MAPPLLYCHPREFSVGKFWRPYFSSAIILILGLSYLAFQTSAASTTSKLNGATDDRLALLSFKTLIADRSGALASWSNSTLHHCQWEGVSCGGRRHPERVIALELDNLNLTGSMSPHLGNLTFLRRLHLSMNQLQGPIPQELGRLFRLRSLNLGFNSLEGEIPTNLSSCTDLLSINISNNMLGGSIPAEFGSLSKLTVLDLGGNPLTGGIPSSLGNISSLIGLLLYENDLEGSIPDGLGKLASLQVFHVARNKLSSEIPSSLYNLSSIQIFDAGENRLVGNLPSNMFDNLPNLQMLILDDNQFSGPIPNSLPNASRLVEVDLKDNKFSGTVPSNLGNLKNLYWINLNTNQLEARDAKDWTFLTSLTNCSLLGTLGLANNRLGGELPSSIANLSRKLDLLSMGQNQISGSIPEGIGNLVNLTVFLVNDNRLTGIIPSSIGKLRKLRLLVLPRNNFIGQIPSSIGNLTQLLWLYLEESGLSGTIPAEFGNCKSLQELDLAYNKLSGAIPRELVGLSSLSIFLNLSGNALVGSLPTEVGNLKNLGQLDISENRLSGEIPSTLGDCQSLEYLYMEGNLFQGNIPQALSNLKGLQELDLSHNNLSGPVPEFLGRLSTLLHLDLSFNDLTGEVPKEGVFKNASAVSVLGNDGLCGGIVELNLPSCNTKSSRKKHMSVALKAIIPVISAVLCLVLLLSVCMSRRWVKNCRRTSSPPSIKDQFLRVSYFDLFRATNGFSSSNLIGAGSFGSVYKGVLDSNEQIVAVKVLDLQQRGASKSFMAECEALRNIRHRNLVKILTSCSGVNVNGDDFKALVLEFMPNGSLEKWLHPEESLHSGTRTLNLIQRLNIAIDVASALDYLHHHSQMPIVHCDLKPSNVLLDDDMCAHLSDFGLARILSDEVFKSHEYPSSSVGIRGTIGYIAPEYGLAGQVSTKGDVYSYGILLLEMFTGRRPTDDISKAGLELYKYVEMAFPDRVLDVVDPRLLLWEDHQDARGDFLNNNEARMEEQKCMVSVIRIGLSCSKEDPRERMEMGNVVSEMSATRDMLLRNTRSIYVQ